MPSVESSSRASSKRLESVKGLSKELDRLYEKLATGINSKRDTLIRSRAPTTNDFDYEVGTEWIYQRSPPGTPDEVYMLTSRLTLNTVTWTQTA